MIMATNLVRLKLHELSLVDSPANKSAKVTIFKRLDDQDKSEPKEENNMTEAEVKKAVDAAIEETLTKQKELDAKIEALTKENNVLKLRAEMTAEEKQFSKESKMTPEEEAAFMADEEKKKKEKMASFLSKRQSDESLEVDGMVIKKSEVGEASFHVMKSQQEALKKAQDDNETVRLEKRAFEEFPNVAGTSAEKAKVLKALASAPKEVQAIADAIFKSANDMASKAFTNLGHKKIDAVAKTSSDFNTKVSEIMKRDNSTRTQAMEKAREESPEAFKALQEAAA